MRKDRLRQRKREFEHATASGGRVPRMNELVLSYCSADSGVVEGVPMGSKRLVKTLSYILMISLRIKTGNRMGQNQLFLSLPAS